MFVECEYDDMLSNDVNYTLQVCSISHIIQKACLCNSEIVLTFKGISYHLFKNIRIHWYKQCKWKCQGFKRKMKQSETTRRACFLTNNPELWSPKDGVWGRDFAAAQGSRFNLPQRMEKEQANRNKENLLKKIYLMVFLNLIYSFIELI